MPRANITKWNINASRVAHFERFAVQRTPNNSSQAYRDKAAIIRRKSAFNRSL